MKHKILPALLTAAVIGTAGFAPLTVQAASLEQTRQELQSKGIYIVGPLNSTEELKQKLEALGYDCTIPNWLDCIIPGLPGNPGQPDNNQPGNPELPDDNQPETPDLPDDNQPENPDLPDNNQPENPGLPDNNQPENPELPDGNQPGTPELPDNNQPETPEQPDVDEDNNAFIQQVVNLVNQERSKAGLSPVKADTSVQAAAQVRAKEIETSFSHTRPDGSSFSTALTQQGVTYRGSGENIAWGQKTPEQVMNGWMNSEGHRANILNKNYTTIGVGLHQNASGTNYWTQLFTY
ncbi:CAP domain-containing protein [Clostridium sp. D5]|uniref:CAP domain-containing protein n=1 Tax=Clostridium sp. D5 TaxID=556261 RepID=UPI0002F9252B|nr:CAP domain-containing protein [Clostridium sp. D5]